MASATTETVYFVLLPDLSCFRCSCPSVTEILLFLWPLFFVAASRNAPSLKARSFKSPLWTSARREVELSGPVEISPPWSRRGELDRPSKHLVAHNGETV